jgi:DNA-binding MarR family transcriptional regulator
MVSKAKSKIRQPATNYPFSALLSKLLIAFTIEIDNAFERSVPHRTTAFGNAADAAAGVRAERGAWLGSFVLWANTMRLVSETGITIAELERQARTDKQQLPGLERWGYITIAPDPADRRPKPPERDLRVRPTVKGAVAQRRWQPLAGEIEKRWQERFGAREIDSLRKALAAVLEQIDLAMPEFLPILGYGLFAQIVVDDASSIRAHTGEVLAKMDLVTLLAKVLLAFTIEFEFDWKISLPVYANGLRLLGKDGIPVRELPGLTGLAKEGVAFITGWLTRHGYAEIKALSGSRGGKAIQLTAQGLEAKRSCAQRLETVETRWRERFSSVKMTALYEATFHLLTKKDGERPLLSEGLTPHTNGWRARKPYLTQTLLFLDDPVAALPQYPMVLHRGGYPDGS